MHSDLTYHAVDLLSRPVALELGVLEELGASIRAGGLASWAATGGPGRGGATRAGDVAVIPVHGIVFEHRSVLSSLLGVSCDELRAELFAAMANPNVRAVAFDIDSPGGVVAGVGELADLIRGYRQQKPIVAWSAARMDSAAFWLGSAASEVVLSSGAECGSIGVFLTHFGLPDARMTVVSAGRYKTETHPFQALPASGRRFLQQRCDHEYGRFVASVAAGRGVSEAAVRGGFGEGRACHAQEAVRCGLADRIDSREGVVGWLQRDGRALPASAVRSRALELERLWLEGEAPGVRRAGR